VLTASPGTAVGITMLSVTGMTWVKVSVTDSLLTYE
jgi:hypothetical protein